jgi:predicted nucleic-acid-binding protein
MIGLDTNILIRFFGSETDDANQIAAAQDLVRKSAPVFLNPIVLAEFVWTLRQTYELERGAIHARLAGIVDAPEFSVMFPDATRRAVELYRKGPADFADYLLGEINLEAGCDTTMTFDRDASKSPIFTKLSA